MVAIQIHTVAVVVTVVVVGVVVVVPMDELVTHSMIAINLIVVVVA